MTETTSLTGHDALLARAVQVLSVRTLQQVAQESRLDAESLKELVERYEIDYAWHVLGAQRTRDAVLAAVVVRLARPLSEVQTRNVVDLLQALAAAQPVDALLSFDNDIPEHVSALLCEWFEGRAIPADQAA